MPTWRARLDISLWRAQIASFAGLLVELSASWGGWLPAEIDVGGGWPFPIDPVGRRPAQARTRPQPADAADYARDVAESLAENLRDRGLARPGMLLEAEPGRAIYARRRAAPRHGNLASDPQRRSCTVSSGFVRNSARYDAAIGPAGMVSLVARVPGA